MTHDPTVSSSSSSSRSSQRAFLLVSACALLAVGVWINVDRHVLGQPEEPLEMEIAESPPAAQVMRMRSASPHGQRAGADEDVGGQGQRHRGEEGKMGRPTSKSKVGTYAMKGPANALPHQSSRNADPNAVARRAGILGEMKQESGHFLVSPYGAEVFEMEVQQAPQWSEHDYREYVGTSFVTTADDPVSTFSIDVDTGAYSLARRSLLQDRRLPMPGGVRVEEMINYFDYAYPEPTGEVPVSITSEVGPCPWDPEHRLVHVGLQGRHVAPGKTPPRNLVFLIDVSGSMGGELPLVVSSLATLTEQLGPKDTISIAVYAGAAGQVLPPTSGADKIAILGALDRLEAGGSTNGGEGIHLAYRMAQENFVEGGINRVILATDGDFNVGVVGQPALVELIEAKRRTGVFLSALGFGSGNFRDSTMEQLADKGNGNYAYIDGLAEAHKVLAEQAGSTLVTIAKDVKIQVEIDPELVSSYRLVGYDNRRLADRDFDDDTKDAGEIGAGHTVTALYEVVPKADAPAVGTVMALKLRYKQPDGDQSLLVEVPIRDEGSALPETSDAFRFSAAVASFGQALSRTPTKAKVDSLEDIRDLAADARGADRHCRRLELVRLIETASALRDQRIEPRRISCTPSSEPATVVYAEPLTVADGSDEAPFDWGRFVIEVLYALPPLLAFPLFFMALRRRRR